MSILNRPGWANRVIVNEGRLHSDELKQRITNLFVRTSLGNSPTYAVSKIADILRREKGEDVDINEIADEDIIRIANDEEVTNGKFQPELKGSIADARQETEDQMSGIDNGLPSDGDEQETGNDEFSSDSDEQEENPEEEDTDESNDFSFGNDESSDEDSECDEDQRPKDEHSINEAGR
jgi:hypothetical protein